jgi:hypothetical protein
MTPTELRHMAERLRHLALETSDSLTRMRLNICAKELEAGAAELEIDKPPIDSSARGIRKRRRHQAGPG